MSFLALTSAQCDANSPGDETLFQLIRTNFDDHETRIKTLEDPSVRVFSHFNSRVGAAPNANQNVDDVLLDAGIGEDYNDRTAEAGGRFTGRKHYWNYEGKFYLSADSNGAISNFIGNAIGSDQHFLRFSTVGKYALIAQPAFHFNNRTKPLTFKLRIRSTNWEPTVNNMNIGFVAFPAAGFARATDGVFMEIGAAGVTRWRFTSANNSTYTVGADFTHPANNTWTEIVVLFESSPGNQARCYLDGVLKETLTTNLPTARNIYGGMILDVSAGSWDVDRLEVSASGPLGDSA
jgi:hypothetical protein